MSEQIIRPGAPASGRVTPASFPFYTTGEDNLRVTSWNAAAGVRLVIDGRFLDASSRATPARWDHTPNTDRSAATSDLPLSGSTLLNLTVFASAGAPQMGQTFVKVDLIRGIGVGAIVLGTILQGYVTAAQALGWPGSAIASSLDSGGYLRAVTGTTPAAGVGFLETVPAGARWEVLHVFAILTTSAVAGVRHTALYLTNPGALTAPCAVTLFPDASTNVQYLWAQNLPASSGVYNTSKFSQQPIPLVTTLLAGGTFASNTENMGVADQWAAPVYLVREWLEP